jgi:transposase
VVDLQPVLSLLDEIVRSAGYVRMDEARTVFLDVREPSQRQGRMWVRMAGRPGRRVVLFDADEGLSTLPGLLAGTSGYLQSPGDPVYTRLAARLGLRHVGCLSRSRGTLAEAIATASGPRSAIRVAREALGRIDALYAIEKEAGQLSGAQRQHVRRCKARPLLESFHPWLLSMRPCIAAWPAVARGFDELLEGWSGITLYLEDGELEIDTSAVDAAIRSFSVGRDRWIVMANRGDASHTAALYSLMATARANRLEPAQYLRRLFERLPFATSAGRLKRLLPLAGSRKPAASPAARPVVRHSANVRRQGIFLEQCSGSG